MRGAILAFLGAASIFAAPAYAEALHGYCTPSCPDMGSNSPTTSNPPTFGFAYSGGPASGTLLVDILSPNNVPQPATFVISNGTTTYNAAIVNATTAWTSGKLESYLGLSASPATPIGNYIPDPQDPAATGFWVYQATIPSASLIGTSAIGTTTPPYSLNQGLAQGAYIVAYLNIAGTRGYIATANSGSILETRPPLPEPATWAMMLLGFGGIGVAMRRRRKTTLPQIA